MALNATEESQVRQLIDRLADLTALADSQPLIASKLGAQKVSLSDLPIAATVSNDDILLIRQGTTDRTVSFGVIAAAAAGGAMLQSNNLSDVLNKPVAFDTIKQAATEIYAGVVELATDLETTTGTDGTRAATPRGVLASITQFFTGKKATQAQVDAGTDDVNYTTSAKVRDGYAAAESGIAGSIGLANTTGESAPGWQGYVRLPKYLGALQISYGYTRVGVASAVGSVSEIGSLAFTVPFVHVFGMVVTTISNGSNATEPPEVKANLKNVSNTNYNIQFIRLFGSNPASPLEQVGASWLAIGRWA